MQSANDNQVGGTHYATGDVQHWDFVQGALNGRYLEGNITKYIARHHKKNGLQDVDKAIHYAKKLHELYKEGAVRPIRQPGEVYQPPMLTRFLEATQLGHWERLTMIAATMWSNETQLEELIRILGNVRGRYHEPEDATSAYVGQGSEP
jgi:hypothetical protein